MDVVSVDKRKIPRPLGMESGTIKDSQITASSETENGTRDQSRLNAGPEKAMKEYSITQISIQGKMCHTDNICEMPPEFVYLKFDGKRFRQNGKKRRFPGSQSDHVITHTLICSSKSFESDL
ncbi:hypothetical protein OS493_039489 [Desmophyllum pertusum]|uniref:Uncharacterized protein n=1 Tax=Desmophyllum pertusum TaxID=174260 RepID=A0A9W9ZHS3_9CNID|nr:hypothetical protein OS493_039489 [Desmophyllum pertusum]